MLELGGGGFVINGAYHVKFWVVVVKNKPHIIIVGNSQCLIIGLFWTRPNSTALRGNIAGFNEMSSLLVNKKSILFPLYIIVGMRT